MKGPRLMQIQVRVLHNLRIGVTIAVFNLGGACFKFYLIISRIRFPKIKSIIGKILYNDDISLYIYTYRMDFYQLCHISSVG